MGVFIVVLHIEVRDEHSHLLVGAILHAPAAST